MGNGARPLLDFVDVLVDGPYVAALRNTDLLSTAPPTNVWLMLPPPFQLGTVKLYKDRPDSALVIKNYKK